MPIVWFYKTENLQPPKDSTYIIIYFKTKINLYLKTLKATQPHKKANIIVKY